MPFAVNIGRHEANSGDVAPGRAREDANPAASMSSVMTTIGIVRVAFWRPRGTDFRVDDPPARSESPATLSSVR